MPREVDNLLFFTCANAKYERYVPLYLISCLLMSDGAKVEVGIESISFLENHRELISYLNAHYPDRFLIRRVNWHDFQGKTYLPHVVRFITEPKTKADYVYIGDVDILFLDTEFPQQHLAFMERTGLPYANSVREITVGTGEQRTTGLHFTKWEAFYPLPDLSGIKLYGNIDEVALSRIIERKGLPLQEKEWWRPVPGIHMSPNRDVIQGGWDIESWKAQYFGLRGSPAFEELRVFLPKASLDLLDEINLYLSSNRL